MTRQLPTTIITTSYAYTTRLHQSVTVGALAKYLSRVESNVHARTFEVARSLPLDMRVQDINILAGDRLLIANDPIKVTELPGPPRPGSEFVRVVSSDFTVDLPAKKRIAIGWTDKPSGVRYDIDLRRIATPDLLPYIAQHCMELEQIDNQWFAYRTGETRIALDELDLPVTPVRLNEGQWVRIYAPNGTYPILEFEILLETVDTQHTIAPLASGTMFAGVQPGIEDSTRFIRASGRLTLRQIVAAVARHDAISLGNAAVYLAHALPLATPLHQFTDLDGFLHVPLETRQARRVLQLRDQYHMGKTYSIRSGRNDQQINLGWRSAGRSVTTALDLDLFQSLIAVSPAALPATEVKAYLNYSAFAETWSLSAAQDSPVAVFINENQVGTLPIRITVGDTIAFGTDPHDPFVRLKADITIE